MIGKRFWILSVLVAVVWGGVYATEAVAAPMAISICQEINNSGSYELTGNLNHDGITSSDGCLVVNVDSVTIDLKGFTIYGNDEDIGILGSSVEKLVVRNGTIRDFDFGFASVGLFNRVEGIIAVGNDLDGISVASHGIITNSSGSGNGRQGIICGGGCIISNNIANQNNGDGFELDSTNNIFNNTAVGNQGDGIQVSCPSNLVGNTAQVNGVTSGVNLNQIGVS
ncbi:MAG: hypothetical protein ACREOW_06940 [Thermodesulfobacteriota bacterium]